MLGVLGFFLAAISVILFTLSFDRAFGGLDKRVKSPFMTAMGLLVSVFALCGTTLLFNQSGDNLMMLILSIDILMLVGTGFMLRVIIDISRPLILITLTLFLSLFVTLRATMYLPTAQIRDGLLYFNLEGEPRFLLLAIILGVWIPAMVIAARRGLRGSQIPTLFSPILSFAYMMLGVSTAIFFSTIHRGTIIASFALLILMFLNLTAINMYIVRLRTVAHKKGIHHGK